MNRWTKTGVLLGVVASACVAPLVARAQGEKPLQKAAEGKDIWVTVVDNVKKPGSFKLSAKATVLDALLAAGGMTIPPESASITLFRGKSRILIRAKALLEGRTLQIAPLQDGDVVLISKDRQARIALPRLRTGANATPSGKSFLFNGRKVYVIPLKMK